MKPLIVLISVFIGTLFVRKIFRGHYDFAYAGRTALSAMLLFTAIGHFAYTEGMAMMLPEFIPFKTEVVYMTGVIEIVAAIGLFIPNFRIITGWLLILFFILILPANIYAALKHIDYQQANFNGNGPVYLWFRVPLQILFIVWTYIFAIKADIVTPGRHSFFIFI
ncbi:MAG TPA: hypothetical protein DIW47_03905 [Bacteroidetes bacterium]|nr:hypothetical protein [Bacteroidota bacterium]